MSPTLRSNGIYVFSKLKLNKIRRGDVIAFRRNNKLLIKRVIGMPKETVRLDLHHKVISINDKEYAINLTSNDHLEFLWRTKPKQYVVLGDNLAQSTDSRDFDVIPGDQMKYRLKLGIWPFTRKFNNPYQFPV